MPCLHSISLCHNFYALFHRYGRLYVSQLSKINVGDLFSLGGFVGASLDLAGGESEDPADKVQVFFDQDFSSTIDKVEPFIPSKFALSVVALFRNANSNAGTNIFF